MTDAELDALLIWANGLELSLADAVRLEALAAAAEAAEELQATK